MPFIFALKSMFALLDEIRARGREGNENVRGRVSVKVSVKVGERMRKMEVDKEAEIKRGLWPRISKQRKALQLANAFF